MIKNALIEAIQKRLQQHDKTGKYEKPLVEQYITLATNRLMMNVADFDLYTKLYKSIIIAQDDDTDEYYSEYPDSETRSGEKAQIVDTIDVAKGVRRINTMKGTGLQFAPIRGDEIQLFEGLDVSSVSDVIAYRPEVDRIVYMGTPTINGEVVTSVRMHLVVAFTEYALTDNYHIPGGNDLELFEVILQIMAGIPPKDLLNNNADMVTPERSQA